jgi:hypothetical protein
VASGLGCVWWRWVRLVQIKADSDAVGPLVGCTFRSCEGFKMVASGDVDGLGPSQSEVVKWRMRDDNEAS